LLLLAIAQRRTASHSLLAPALSEPTSNLERRINAMRIPLQTPSRARLAILGGVAATAIIVACAIDAPMSATPIEPAAAVRASRADTGHVVTVNVETPTGPRSNRVRVFVDSITPGEHDGKSGRQEHTLTVRPPIVEEDAVAYKEYQLTKMARQVQNGFSPVYPASLNAAGVEGEVLASFVVDTLGRSDTTSFKVLKSTDPLFSAAVRTWLPNAQFIPAEISGRKVREVVQLPFVFTKR
jgi:outer membrane biosynthesis protein TonB